MKKIIFFLLFPFIVFGYQIEIKTWKKGETFYGFLKQNNLPLSIYYNLDKKTQKQLKFISNSTDIFLLKDLNTIKQALIPFNQKQQLQIIKKNNKYITKIVPIEYSITEKTASINIENFLSYDVYKATKNPYLARKIVNIFNDRINFRLLPKNTQIKLLYKIKSRFSKIVNVEILYAQIKNRHYTINAFKFNDGRYYDENGRSLKGMFLAYPMKFKRISSKFGMRFHPILHRMRMHDGIDFVNKIGTPIKSVADGKIIYKGWLGGYGKAIKVRHKNHYITIYAHMKNFSKIRLGQYIKQGQIIGYMGNTGLSTGPHLHFGVMHYGKWINPIKIKKSAKIVLYGKRKKQFLAMVNKIENQLDSKVALK